MNTINTRLARESRRSGNAPRPAFGVNRSGDSLRTKTRISSGQNITSKRASSSKAKEELVVEYQHRATSNSKTKKRKFSLARISIAFVMFIICVLTLAKGTDVIMSKFTNKNDSITLSTRVAGLIKLKDTNPKIYKVSDVAPLKSKSVFYEAVMPGDYVLVYNEDQKVLIYRESANMIVNIDSVSNL